jgi:hypothetical protein
MNTDKKHQDEERTRQSGCCSPETPFFSLYLSFLSVLIGAIGGSSSSLCSVSSVVALLSCQGNSVRRRDEVYGSFPLFAYPREDPKMRTMLILPLLAALLYSPNLLLAKDTREGKLAVTLAPARKVFPKSAVIQLKMTLKNTSTEPIVLGVAEYLGNQTVGSYTYRFQNKKTKEVWKVGRDPTAILPGAPVRLRRYELAPGKVLTLKVRVPIIGQRFWQGGTEKAPKITARHLPPGEYEVMLSTRINDQKVEVKTSFRIAEK